MGADRALPPLAPLPDLVLRPLVQGALTEDLGQHGDLTSAIMIAEKSMTEAMIVARENGRIAGLDCARLAFSMLDPAIGFTAKVNDGQDVTAGQEIVQISGNTRAILAAERTALNFLGHLSGIATMTQAFVVQLRGTKAKMACTRKTLPGLRAVQKYAVRAGGGINHRFGLGDAILIKDNHIAALGSVAKAMQAARVSAGHMRKIEIEVDALVQLEEALPFRPDVVLLDNMDLKTLTAAVKMVDGRAITEASGGVSLQNLAAIAATGVDVISSSALTMKARALDLALDFTV